MRPVFVIEAAGDEQTYLKADNSALMAHVCLRCMFTPSCRMASIYALHCSLLPCTPLLSVCALFNQLTNLTFDFSSNFSAKCSRNLSSFNFYFQFSSCQFNDHSFSTHFNMLSAALGRTSPLAQPVIRGVLIDQNGSLQMFVLVSLPESPCFGKSCRRSFVLLEQSRFFRRRSGTIGSVHTISHVAKLACLLVICF